MTDLPSKSLLRPDEVARFLDNGGEITICPPHEPKVSKRIRGKRKNIDYKSYDYSTSDYPS